MVFTIIKFIWEYRTVISILLPFAKKAIILAKGKDLDGAQKKLQVIEQLKEVASKIFKELPAEHILELVFSTAYRWCKVKRLV